jgi:hypothetical protein
MRKYAKKKYKKAGGGKLNVQILVSSIYLSASLSC